MNAGRELDALIADKVMGLRVRHRPGMEPCIMPANGAPWETIPHYSTDIRAAWEVVEKLDLLNGLLLGRFAYGREDPYWAVYDCGQDGLDDCRGHGDTPTVAICNAALKQAGVKEPA